MKQNFFIGILFLQILTAPIHSFEYSAKDLEIIHSFSRLHLPNIPSTFYMQTRSYSLPIMFSSPTAYQSVIEKWQHKMNLGYEKLFKALYNELSLRPQDVMDLFNDPVLIQHQYLYNHGMVLMHKLDGWIDSKHVHPDIIKFIELQLKKYTAITKVQLFFSDSLNSLVKVYGSLEHGYAACFNVSLYNTRYIKEYHAFVRKQPSSYHVKYMGDGLGVISNAMFMHSGFIQAAGTMSSNINRLEYLLGHYDIHQESISVETLTLFSKLKYFQSLLECVFQVNNPLELAIFYMKADWFDQSTIALWIGLVRDLLACYDKETLQKYFAFITSIQNEVLSS